LAKLYEDLGDPVKAIQQMEQLAAFASEDGECRLRIAKNALQIRDYEKAAKFLQELLYIQPFDMQIHSWLAEAAEKINDYDTVIREQKLLLNDPGTNTLLAHLALASAYLGKGNKGKALEEAEIVLSIDPQNTKALQIKAASSH
jgi:tetratricopeptide (TPR) repeat protein